MGNLSVVTINPDLLNLRDIILREKVSEIKIEDSTYMALCQKLSEEMFEVMYAHDGAALAAPQVGISLRLVVMDPGGMDFGPHVLINPIITIKSDEEDEGFEGCLSLPNYTGTISRSNNITVKTYNLRGDLEIYNPTGWLARIFQHEIDHLNGILYPDHLKQGNNLEYSGSVAHRRAKKSIEKISYA